MDRFDDLKQYFCHLLAVDPELGSEETMAAMLAQCLGGREQLDVGRIPFFVLSEITVKEFQLGKIESEAHDLAYRLQRDDAFFNQGDYLRGGRRNSGFKRTQRFVIHPFRHAVAMSRDERFPVSARGQRVSRVILNARDTHNPGFAANIHRFAGKGRFEIQKRTDFHDFSGKSRHEFRFMAFSGLLDEPEKPIQLHARNSVLRFDGIVQFPSFVQQIIQMNHSHDRSSLAYRLGLTAELKPCHFDKNQKNSTGSLHHFPPFAKCCFSTSLIV